MTLNEDVFEDIQVSSQEYIILKSFDTFYQKIYIINKFLKILNGDIHNYKSLDRAISIRLIDFFVTKYSKNHKIIFKINNPENNNISQVINVYNSYKQQLKVYQKKHFDPFSRGYRIPYFLNDTCIITTISQLNFFKWFFSYGLYEYILEYYNDIENEMNLNNKIKVEKKPKTKKNKIKISHHIYNNIPTNNITNNNIVVSFN
jgi:hypothetical protein